MTQGVTDTDAVMFTLNDNDISQIRFLAAKDFLMVGTATKEYIVRASNPDDPITPTSDIRAIAKSAHGSGAMQPVFLNDALFFMQGQGRKIRAYRVRPDLVEAKADDATLLANHMFESSPVQFAVQQIPDSILWVVREDGTLCSFTYEPEEEVLGWARHITGSQASSILDGTASPSAKFESVAVIKGEREDEVWVIVQRTINGSTVRYVEKLMPRIADQIDEMVMLDCAKIVESSYEAQNIVYASDTIVYGYGVYGSGRYGVE